VVLIEMHALGVIHGDLAPRNMTCDPSTDRVLLYDFSDAFTSGGGAWRRWIRRGVRARAGLLRQARCFGGVRPSRRGEPGHDHPAPFCVAAGVTSAGCLAGSSVRARGRLGRVSHAATACHRRLSTLPWPGRRGGPEVPESRATETGARRPGLCCVGPPSQSSCHVLGLDEGIGSAGAAALAGAEFVSGRRCHRGMDRR
jgi:hypothetical protein